MELPGVVLQRRRAGLGKRDESTHSHHDAFDPVMTANVHKGFSFRSRGFMLREFRDAVQEVAAAPFAAGIRL